MTTDASILARLGASCADAGQVTIAALVRAGLAVVLALRG